MPQGNLVRRMEEEEGKATLAKLFLLLVVASPPPSPFLSFPSPPTSGQNELYNIPSAKDVPGTLVTTGDFVPPSLLLLLAQLFGLPSLLPPASSLGQRLLLSPPPPPLEKEEEKMV